MDKEKYRSWTSIVMKSAADGLSTARGINDKVKEGTAKIAPLEIRPRVTYDGAVGRRS